MTARPASRGERIPGPALAAGLLGMVAAAALALLVLAVLGLARWGESAITAWLVGLLLVPPLQIVAAIVLLCRRGWLPLALAALPGAALFGYLFLSSLPAGGTHLSPVLLGALGLSLPALLLTLLPATRAWATGRSGGN